MKFVKKVLCIILIISSIFVIHSDTTHAKALDAESNFNIHIELSDDKSAKVTYFIHLTNQSTRFSIRNYSLVTTHTDAVDVKALENGKKVGFEKKGIEDKVQIKVNLKKELVHKGDDVNLQISYETNKILKKEGINEEIYIPPIKTEEKLDIAYFTLVMPEDYENMIYSSLGDVEFSKKDGKRILKYSQRKAPFGVLFSFGDTQHFEFEYKFLLENNSFSTKKYLITLPPDSDFQTVHYFDANHVPEGTFRDKEGNTIAQYILPANQKKQVEIRGFSQFKIPKSNIDLSQELKDRYTEESDIWDISSEQLRETINTITRDDYSLYENVRFIYDYLDANFSYSEGMKDRVKVSELIKEKGSITCEQFSDIFVALVRAKQIPARGVVGYTTVTSQINALHYWAEFFDEKEERWVAVDPCLKKYQRFEEFDNININRFIFAYHGLSDDFPDVVPPFMKFQEFGGNNIEVKISSYEFAKDDSDIDISYSVDAFDMLFKNIPFKVILENKTHNIVEVDKMLLNGSEVLIWDIYDKSGDFRQVVFPGAKEKFALDIENDSNSAFLKNSGNVLGVFGRFGENDFEKDIDVDLSQTFTYKSLIPWVGSGLLACLLVAGAIIGYNRRYFLLKLYKNTQTRIRIGIRKLRR